MTARRRDELLELLADEDLRQVADTVARLVASATTLEDVELAMRRLGDLRAEQQYRKLRDEVHAVAGVVSHGCGPNGRPLDVSR